MASLRRKGTDMLNRHFFVWLHRWAGLAMACFLVIVGLTGSLLAFRNEIDRLASPRFFAKPQPGVARLTSPLSPTGRRP